MVKELANDAWHLRLCPIEAVLRRGCTSASVKQYGHNIRVCFPRGAFQSLVEILSTPKSL
jgi:hypothetical protein